MIEHVYRLGCAEIPDKYTELCVIAKDSDEVNRLLIDFSDQYEPELPAYFNTEFDRRLSILLKQIDQTIEDLSDFYVTSIKNKLEYFNVIKTIKNH